MGMCIVQIQNVRVNFACTKRIFNLSAEAITNVRNARLCARCAIFFLKIKRIPFSYRLVRGVYNFEESPKSIQDVIGDVYCPGKYCFNREMRISWWSCNNSESHLWLWKCGARLFVHKVPFMLQEHVKRTKTDKTRFFFVKKDELVTRPTIVNYCPISINEKLKKELCVDNKVQETIGDMYCPTCRNEKCVYISTIKNVWFLRL